MAIIFTIIFFISISSSLRKCPDLDNLVDYLPNQPVDSYICHYAGYLQNSEIFYWLFIRKTYDLLINYPIIVYIGNGVQSNIQNVFLGNGPLQLELFNNTIYLQERPYSITNYAHILYLEQPGVFSFSNYSKGRNTVDQMVRDIINFLVIFGQKYSYYFETIYFMSDEILFHFTLRLANRYLELTDPILTLSGIILNSPVPHLKNCLKDFTESKLTDFGFFLDNYFVESAQTYISTQNSILSYSIYSNIKSFMENITSFHDLLSNYVKRDLTNYLQLIDQYMNNSIVIQSLHSKSNDWILYPVKDISDIFILYQNFTDCNFKGLEQINILMIGYQYSGIYSQLNLFSYFRRTCNITNFTEYFYNAKSQQKIGIYKSNNIYEALADHQGFPFLHEDKVIDLLEDFFDGFKYILPCDNSQFIQLWDNCSGEGIYNLSTYQCDCIKSSNPKGLNCSDIYIHEIIENNSYQLKPNEWIYFKLNIYVKTTVELKFNESYINYPLVYVSKDKHTTPDEQNFMLSSSSKRKLYLQGDLKREVIIGIENKESLKVVSFKIDVQGYGPNEALKLGLLFVSILSVGGFFIFLILLSKLKSKTLIQ